MISYEQLLQVRSPERVYSWTECGVMLYGLGPGCGRDPLDPAELAFATEANLKPVPTVAAVAAWGARPSHCATGVDYTQVVHSEQTVIIDRPLQASGEVSVFGRVTGATDKVPNG